MKRTCLTGALCATVSYFISLSSYAALIPKLGGQVVYDDDRNITWMADANLAASNTFGLATEVSLGTHPDDTSGEGAFIFANGDMNWPGALFWIDAMNAANYLGFNDWRLPTTLVPDNGCTSEDGTARTDSQGFDCTGSEMGHLFYDEFGAERATPESVLNTGNPVELAKFSNISPNFSQLYWSGTEFNSTVAWSFDMGGDGGQISSLGKSSTVVSAWAVRSGDVSAVPMSAGTPVVYTFSGTLTGFSGGAFSPINIDDVPFKISIYGDINNVTYVGEVAGAGSLYANNSTKATWEVDGFGTAFSSSVQIYTVPGVGRIGFSWDGIKYPLNGGQPAPTQFDFFGHSWSLRGIVDPDPVSLLQNLENPPGFFPQYTTSINFDGIGSLTLKELTNITFATETDGNMVLKYSSYLATGFTDFDVIDIATDISGNAYIAGKANSTSGMPVVAGGFGDPDYVLPQSFVLKYSPDNVLLYSAFLQDAEITAIEIDNAGRAYLAGGHQGTGSSPYCDNWGGFIIRLSPDGSSMNYCSQTLPTFGFPDLADISIDKDGNSYVIGSYAGVNLPVTPGVFQSAPAGLDDVYVIKMAEDGSAVLSAFFLGGSGDDIGRSIYVADDGTIYVSGDTESLDFPSGTVNHGGYDVFVAKISNDGSVLRYSELFGGSGEDRALSMAVDNKDSIYIGGATTSVDYPTTAGVVQPTFGGDADSLLFKLRSDNTIHFATYLGGAGVSNVQSIGVGPDGTVYITGINGDPDFPVTTGAFQEIYPLTLRNAYFSAINADGTALKYSTFLGSNIPNVGLSDNALTGAFALDVRNIGEVLIVGKTNSEDFPVSDDASQDTLRGRADYFLSIFDYSTLAITTPYLIADTTIGEYFQYTLSATEGRPPYEWFSYPKYLPIGVNLSTGGVLEGTPTGIISSEKLYAYFLPETVQFLPIIVGVRDQDGRVAYKEILSQFFFALPNVEPTANAGTNRTVRAGDSVRLDGRTSGDSDGSIDSYSWKQISGVNVNISGSNTARPTFTAPSKTVTLIFELTVTDDQGAADSDTVTIEVTVSNNSSNVVQATGGGGGGGGGGCTTGKTNDFDPTLPGFLIISFFIVAWKKKANNGLPSGRDQPTSHAYTAWHPAQHRNASPDQQMVYGSSSSIRRDLDTISS